MKVKKVVDSRLVRSASATSVDSQASSVPVVENKTRPHLLNEVDASIPTGKHNKPKGNHHKNSSKPKQSSPPSSPNTKKNKKKKRSVRFNEEANVFYDDEIPKEERKFQWYSHKENQAFKERTMKLVKRIVASEEEEGNPHGWLLSLQAAYHGFCQADCVALVEEILVEHRAKTAVKASTTGLEKWAVRSMATDRIQRRKQLWKVIGEIQQQHAASSESNSSSSARQKAKVIRLASRDITRPSRLFAHHSAQLGLRKKTKQSKR